MQRIRISEREERFCAREQFCVIDVNDVGGF